MIPHKVAHKVQNLLTVIMGYFDLGLAALAEDDDQQAAAYFERARNAVREVSQLITRNVERKHSA